MSLLWVIIGTVLQAGFAYFTFMIVAFSGGGLASGTSLSKLKLFILNTSIYILPGICLLCAAIVIFQYINNGSAYSYWWYAVPAFSTAIYLVFVSNINNF